MIAIVIGIHQVENQTINIGILERKTQTTGTKPKIKTTSHNVRR
jgi:hypothetical protein